MENIRPIYNQILALRNNLPDGKYVNKIYVDQFHSLVKKLESIVGSSLTEYYVESSVLRHTSGVAHQDGTFTAFGDPQCERGFLLAKMDALLLMFTTADNPPMGFRASNEE